MGEMCRAVEKNGIIETSCGVGKRNKIMVVNSEPLRVKEETRLSSIDRQKKRELNNQQLNRIRKCYDGALKGGVCKDPIDLILFMHDKCPSCKEYYPILHDRLTAMKMHNIPHTLKTFNVRNSEASHLFKEAGCNGLPCIAMRDPKNPKRFRKITEGIDKEIGFYSNIMGEPNPLIIKTNQSRAPRGLLR